MSKATRRWGATILLAAQHLLITVIYLVYPVIVVAEAGGTQAETAFCVQMSMLAIGLGTILQVRNRGPLGSGFLIPHVTTAAYLHTEALFDEYNLNIHATYSGEPMEFPATPPTEDELMLDKSSLARMSGFMIRFMAEKVTPTVNSSLCRVTIYITH